MTNLRVCGSCLPLLVLAGCGGSGAAPDVGSVSEALLTTNGMEQNGPGLAMAGVDLTTMQRLVVAPPIGGDPDLSPSNLVPVAGVHLAGSMLTDGVIAGTQFAHHVVNGKVTDGPHSYDATFYIEKVTVSAADPEIFHYQIRSLHLVPDDSGCSANFCPFAWDYGCGMRLVRIHNPDGTISTASLPYQATAVGGQWDFHQGQPGDGRKLIEQGNPDYDTKITFACETGAIGKCVERMSYKPWAQATTDCHTVCFDGGKGGGRQICRKKCTSQSRELMHEACVRMVRADYCGDGVSHTVNGINIDVWDNGNINQMSTYTSNPAEGYGKEGEWTPNGARCLSQALMSRVSSDVDSHLVIEYLRAHCDTKWDQEPNMNGAHFDWIVNDCFGQGPSSAHSTWDYVNVPGGYDQHNRVFIKNSSMCITEHERPNPYMSFPPCLQGS